MSDALNPSRYPAHQAVTPVTRWAVTSGTNQFSPQVTATVTPNRHPRRTTLLDLPRHPSPTDASNLSAYADDVRSLIGDPIYAREARAAIDQTLGRPKTVTTRNQEDPE